MVLRQNPPRKTVVFNTPDGRTSQSSPTQAGREAGKVIAEQGNLELLGRTKTTYVDRYDSQGNVVGQEAIQVPTGRQVVVTQRQKVPIRDSQGRIVDYVEVPSARVGEVDDSMGGIVKRDSQGRVTGLKLLTTSMLGQQLGFEASDQILVEQRRNPRPSTITQDNRQGDVLSDREFLEQDRNRRIRRSDLLREQLATQSLSESKKEDLQNQINELQGNLIVIGVNSGRQSKSFDGNQQFALDPNRSVRAQLAFLRDEGLVVEVEKRFETEKRNREQGLIGLQSQLSQVNRDLEPKRATERVSLKSTPPITSQPESVIQETRPKGQFNYIDEVRNLGKVSEIKREKVATGFDLLNFARTGEGTVYEDKLITPFSKKEQRSQFGEDLITGFSTLNPFSERSKAGAEGFTASEKRGRSQVGLGIINVALGGEAGLLVPFIQEGASIETSQERFNLKSDLAGAISKDISENKLISETKKDLKIYESDVGRLNKEGDLLQKRQENLNLESQSQVDMFNQDVEEYNKKLKEVQDNEVKLNTNLGLASQQEQEIYGRIRPEKVSLIENELLPSVIAGVSLVGLGAGKRVTQDFLSITKDLTTFRRVQVSELAKTSDLDFRTLAKVRSREYNLFSLYKLDPAVDETFIIGKTGRKLGEDINVRVKPPSTRSQSLIFEVQDVRNPSDIRTISVKGRALREDIPLLTRVISPIRKESQLSEALFIGKRVFKDGKVALGRPKIILGQGVDVSSRIPETRFTRGVSFVESKYGGRAGKASPSFVSRSFETPMGKIEKSIGLDISNRAFIETVTLEPNIKVGKLPKGDAREGISNLGSKGGQYQELTSPSQVNVPQATKAQDLSQIGAFGSSLKSKSSAIPKPTPTISQVVLSPLVVVSNPLKTVTKRKDQVQVEPEINKQKSNFSLIQEQEEISKGKESFGVGTTEDLFTMQRPRQSVIQAQNFIQVPKLNSLTKLETIPLVTPITPRTSIPKTPSQKPPSPFPKVPFLIKLPKLPKLSEDTSSSSIKLGKRKYKDIGSFTALTFGITKGRKGRSIAGLLDLRPVTKQQSQLARNIGFQI